MSSHIALLYHIVCIVIYTVMLSSCCDFICSHLLCYMVRSRARIHTVHLLCYMVRSRARIHTVHFHSTHESAFSPMPLIETVTSAVMWLNCFYTLCPAKNVIETRNELWSALPYWKRALWEKTTPIFQQKLFPVLVTETAALERDSKYCATYTFTRP